MIDTLLERHLDTINHGFKSINQHNLKIAAETIIDAILDGKNIFTCGNGASASIAQHWACDYTKGCSDIENRFIPRVVSLSANIPLMTAISNDISFDDVYSYQLLRMSNPGDILITISSSGDSPNIVKAIEMCEQLQVTSIALTGFEGGRSKKLADISLHVDIQEYEATEDVHQAIMHMIAKYIRSHKHV